MSDTSVCVEMNKDGKWNGLKIDEDYDGRKFEGLYENNKKNGLGKYTWADGSSYEGNYKDGKRHGYGIYR